MDIFEETIRHHQSIFMVKIFPILLRPLDCLVAPEPRLPDELVGGPVPRSVSWLGRIRKVAKVSSDQMISPVDGFQPKLPVLSRAFALQLSTPRFAGRSAHCRSNPSAHVFPFAESPLKNLVPILRPIAWH